MTRDLIRDEITQITSPNILCELPTSFGKSRIALDIIKNRFPYIDYYKANDNQLHILIVIPRLVLIQNWKDEFEKWGMKEYLPFVTFVTYVSFPKSLRVWDMVIFDEVHHLSERCREAIHDFSVPNYIMLSATVGYKMKEKLQLLFPDLYVYRVSTKKAIEEEILPDPQVYLIPLTLDKVASNYEIIKNKSQKKELVIPFSQRFKYANIKNRRIVIKCTQSQYYADMSSLIEWFKRHSSQKTHKTLFLKKSGDRLKWLSNQKTEVVKDILKVLKNYKTLTFCNSIAQTEELSKYCINSSNKKEATNNLEMFNADKIKHITACNMLDEGVNLVNCRIGIYAVLNSSERLIKQKLGRLLRHSKPIIIIPYYAKTRDEELVKEMLKDYNPKLVKTINHLKDLKL